MDEFRAALKSLGYAEGRDITIELRRAQNRLEALPTLAAELLQLNPAAVVTTGPRAW